MSAQAVPEYEYQRAADAIESMITAGRIQVGSFIKVPEIAKLTETTYPTARVAAKRLQAEGILRAHPGKGYAVVAMPEKAAAAQADARELGRQVAQLRDEARALSLQVERIESNLEDLYDKLGYEYATDTDERGEDPGPAARHGRTG